MRPDFGPIDQDGLAKKRVRRILFLAIYYLVLVQAGYLVYNTPVLDNFEWLRIVDCMSVLGLAFVGLGLRHAKHFPTFVLVLLLYVITLVAVDRVYVGVLRRKLGRCV